MQLAGCTLSIVNVLIDGTESTPRAPLHRTHGLAGRLENYMRFRKRNSNMLEVSGLDIIDKTPLLDIKPYVPRFDSFPDACEGWFAGKEDRPKPSGRE
ncbi:MAG: hypothetical protein H6Q52_684 [Deltaproteobacteria bacterium]|nr:hypothetical protein [Deltaproteobacteria bacterium]